MGVHNKQRKMGTLAMPPPNKIKKCLEMPPTPLCPSQGLYMDASLGKITSYTMLSCTVTCLDRTQPVQYSSVLYRTDLKCKATFVFPFRSSRKMPLSQSL